MRAQRGDAREQRKRSQVSRTPSATGGAPETARWYNELGRSGRPGTSDATVKAGGVSIQLRRARWRWPSYGEGRAGPDQWMGRRARVVRHGDAPQLGLGEGGPSSTAAGRDRMRSGQGGYTAHFRRARADTVVGTAGGRCSSTRRTGRSISRAESKFLPGRRKGRCPGSFFVTSKSPPPSWRSTRGSPGTPSCRRCGASAISSRIARWRAARRCWRRPRRSARRSCPATR